MNGCNKKVVLVFKFFFKCSMILYFIVSSISVSPHYTIPSLTCWYKTVSGCCYSSSLRKAAFVVYAEMEKRRRNEYPWNGNGQYRRRSQEHFMLYCISQDLSSSSSISSWVSNRTMEETQIRATAISHSKTLFCWSTLLADFNRIPVNDIPELQPFLSQCCPQSWRDSLCISLTYCRRLKIIYNDIYFCWTR